MSSTSGSGSTSSDFVFSSASTSSSNPVLSTSISESGSSGLLSSTVSESSSAEVVSSESSSTLLTSSSGSGSTSTVISSSAEPEFTSTDLMTSDPESDSTSMDYFTSSPEESSTITFSSKESLSTEFITSRSASESFSFSSEESTSTLFATSSFADSVASSSETSDSGSHSLLNSISVPVSTSSSALSIETATFSTDSNPVFNSSISSSLCSNNDCASASLSPKEPITTSDASGISTLLPETVMRNTTIHTTLPTMSYEITGSESTTSLILSRPTSNPHVKSDTVLAPDSNNDLTDRVLSSGQSSDRIVPTLTTKYTSGSSGLGSNVQSPVSSLDKIPASGSSMHSSLLTTDEASKSSPASSTMRASHSSILGNGQPSDSVEASSVLTHNSMAGGSSLAQSSNSGSIPKFASSDIGIASNSGIDSDSQVTFESSTSSFLGTASLPGGTYTPTYVFSSKTGHSTMITVSEGFGNKRSLSLPMLAIVCAYLF